MDNKKYALITYRDGNVLDMINFDNIKENIIIESKGIEKIRLFKLNENKDGRNLVKELYINNINDSLLHEEGTEIESYTINERSKSILFNVNYKISSEIKKHHELWSDKRYISIRLFKSQQDESKIDYISAAR